MKVSVKSDMFVSASPRKRAVDGPWKNTFDEAIAAYVLLLRKKGLTTATVYNPFFAVECPEAQASCGSGKIFYNDQTRTSDNRHIDDLLKGLGLTVNSTNRFPKEG